MFELIRVFSRSPKLVWLRSVRAISAPAGASLIAKTEREIEGKFARLNRNAEQPPAGGRPKIRTKAEKTTGGNNEHARKDIAPTDRGAKGAGRDWSKHRTTKRGRTLITRLRLL